MRDSRLAVVLVSALALVAGAHRPAPAVAVASPAEMEREEVRQFLDEGPGLLLPTDERERLAAAPVEEALAAARQFLARDPVPETAENELVQAVERRRRVVYGESITLRDDRGRLLFLLGAPREREKVECGETFRPLELWSYGPVEAPRTVVLVKPKPDRYYIAWRPTESKRTLYTEGMEYYLEQWDELRGRVSGKRPDLQMCKATKSIDQITGVAGLFGFAAQRMTDAQVEAFFAPPKDLAVWARAALAEAAPEGEPLPVASSTISFPERRDQRLLVRLRVELPAGVGLGVAEEKSGREARLSLAGSIEAAGAPFEEFRNRFILPPPQEDQPILLIGERSLRSGGPYVVQLELRDEVSGRIAFLARGFEVPREPVPEPATAPPGAQVVIGEETGLTRARARDALLLLPPTSDVVFGLWRAEVLVVGEKIQKVAFYVDGQRSLVRASPPWSAELRLPNLPSEIVVRAEGLDEQGTVVAADEVLLNEPQGAASVRLLAPGRGQRVSGRIRARAAVVVPEGKRLEVVEFRLNNELLASLTQPPFETLVDVPPPGEPAYLTVSAIYLDGTRVEDFRILNGPQFLEQIQVDLVELYTSVLDREGHPVDGLAAEDFTILDRGRPQKVERFEQVRDLPLSVGIVLDTSGSMRESIGEAKHAAADFLAAVVRPTDRCFAVGFSARPRLLMPLTPDAHAVEVAFRDLPAFGETALHDALVFSLYQLRGIRSRKALVVLSDGDDNSSLVGYQDALEFARRSGASIYTIGLDIGGASVGVRGKLEKLAEETGGRAYFVGRADELANAYAAIERELRSQYLVAFAPDPPGKSGEFSPIEVKVQGGRLKVRAPRGYYP